MSPARLFHILPARFRCSFEERERVDKQCMKGKQILLCERLLNELNTVWNIIIFIKQNLPDACFRCHVDDIEILRVFAWLRSNRRNLCLFAQNVRRSVAHNRDNNKQTITHLAAWRISFAIRLKGKLSVYCRYTRKRTKDQCCVRNLSVEYNCTNCKWSIVTCLIMHHKTYDTPYERYRSS